MMEFNDKWFICFWVLLLALSALESWSEVSEQRSASLRRWPANLGLSLCNSALVSSLPVGAVWVAGLAKQNGIGLVNWAQFPLVPAFLLTILLYSLVQYVFHRLAHRVRWLWSLHRVHHSDTRLDGTTGLRSHPLEVLADVGFQLPFVLALGMLPAALAAYQIVAVIFALFTHTSLPLPLTLDRALRSVIVTPGMHRLHHSDFIRETDTNYGVVFSFWDRLFGTYLHAPLRTEADFKLGLDGIDQAKAVSFDWLLTSPWQRLKTTADAGQDGSSASSK